jgi:DNA-binding transcriptional LysR family regulator
MQVTYDFFEMDVDSLRWLTALADGATVGETAVASHISQPAVSRALQRLSAELGVPLTEAAGRRLRLTPSGRILAESARRSLRELDEGLRAVAEARDPDSGTVRLGFLSPLGTWLIPGLLVGFHAERPTVRFELRHEGASRILEGLRDGELDVLLSLRPEDPALAWEPLFEEELLLALPAGHRLAARRRVRMAELTGERWVLLPPGYDLRRRVEAMAEEEGSEVRPAFEGHDLATLYALIGSGNGIGLFPARPAPPATVRQVRLAPARSRTVGLVTVPGRFRPAAAEAFIAATRAAVADGAVLADGPTPPRSARARGRLNAPGFQ